MPIRDDQRIRPINVLEAAPERDSWVRDMYEHHHRNPHVDFARNPDDSVTTTATMGQDHASIVMDHHYIVRDREAYLRHSARELTHRILSQMEQRMQHDIYEQIRRGLDRQMDRGRTRERFEHGRDVVRGILGKRHSKPEAPERFPKQYEMKDLWNIQYGEGSEKFVATMLTDSMMVWKEAQEMRHCLYKAYTDWMMRGEYIAFHVDCPKRVSKGGKTLGFRRTRDEWKYDQCKGTANSNKNNEALRPITDIIERMLNKNRVSVRNDLFTAGDNNVPSRTERAVGITVF